MKFWLVLLVLFGITAFAKPTAHPKRLRIAIIDTGLDLSDPRFKKYICGGKDFTNTKITDYNGHGTHIAGLIKKYAGRGNYCFLIYKYYTDNASGHTNAVREVDAMYQAVMDGADVVNFSGGGEDSVSFEHVIIESNPQIKFVVAAGNDGKNLNFTENAYYPASYGLPNEFVVGSIDSTGERSPWSNYGDVITSWEQGDRVLSTGPNGVVIELSGTSQSTAIKTGKLVKEMLNARQSLSE